MSYCAISNDNVVRYKIIRNIRKDEYGSTKEKKQIYRLLSAVFGSMASRFSANTCKREREKERNERVAFKARRCHDADNL